MRVLVLFAPRYHRAMPRFASIADIAAAGLEVRIWCLRCARGRQLVAGQIPPIFASLPLAEAVARLRCSGCRTATAVILLPASPPPAPGDEILFDPNYGAEQAVAEFFHTMRSHRKKKRGFPPLSRPGDHVRIAGHMISAIQITLD